MAKLLLTFDYEPFFNDGELNLLRCLIEPTQQILKCLTSRSRNIFFVDATFLLFLRNNKMHEEYNLISQQVEEIANLGHEIGLHIHPHWLDAKLINNSVQHVFDKFALIDCSNDRNEILTDSHQILHDMVRGIKITSFRAGGLILSGWGSFEETLWKLGIKEDHSVVPGYRGKNAGKLIDYSDACLSEPDKLRKFLVDEKVTTPIVEYPITCYRKTTLMKFADLILRQKFTSVLNAQPKANELAPTLAQCDLRYLTCDFVHPFMFKEILRRQRNASYLSFINHPKDFTYSTLKNIRHIYETF